MIGSIIRNGRARAVAAGCVLALMVGCQPAVRTDASAAPESVPPGLTAGTHDVVVNGVRLRYVVGGRAPAGVPPVVFLHGGPGQGSEHFSALVGPAMERGLRMVYLDQRGSGRSDKPANREYSIPLFVEDIEGVRRALGVPRIALLGHSFGGLLALEYAAKYPQHVSHVVFASGVWDFPMQCRLRLKRLAELRPAAYERVRGDTLRSDGTRRSDCELEFQALGGEDRDRFNTEMMFPNPAIEARMDSVNAAAGVVNTGEISGVLFGRGGMLSYRFAAHDRLTMPVLVIAGRHDGAAQPAGLRQLARLLPNARYVEYERAGHFVYLDEPERFARDVTRFVARR